MKLEARLSIILIRRFETAEQLTVDILAKTYRLSCQVTKYQIKKMKISITAEFHANLLILADLDVSFSRF